MRFRIPKRYNLKTGSRAYNATEFHFRTKSTGSKVSSSHSHKTVGVDEKESSTGAPPVALRFIAFLKSPVGANATHTHTSQAKWQISILISTRHIPCYVIRTNKLHTFFLNDLIQLYCLRHVSNIQVFILRKTCTCSFMSFISCIRISSLVDGRMCLKHVEDTIIKLKHWCGKCALCWFYYIGISQCTVR